MHWCNSYDIVCVVSEASKLRSLVSCLTHPKKIQWIHTDYARWSEFSEWTKKVAENDEELYKNYDTIVCLSEISRKGFVDKIVHRRNMKVVLSKILKIHTLGGGSNE